jgi:2-polyprenyl-3-methyl-5-hydroxy-6-metoxy-1,4-benzoquinol methylase
MRLKRRARTETSSANQPSSTTHLVAALATSETANRDPESIASDREIIQLPMQRHTGITEWSSTVRDLHLTGERTLPGIPHENYWFRRHQAAYEHVAELTAGQTALDIGSGEGYGPAALAGHARLVVGLDYDTATIRHASTTYPDAGFAVANLAALPIRDQCVDVIVCLQVIEHVWDHSQFLRECRRVLRPGGQLVVATPNRLTFSPGRIEPVNPFHSREFSAAELAEVVTNTGFVDIACSGVHPGRHLAELDRRHHGLVDAQLTTPLETWSARLRADVAAIRSTDFLILPAADRDIDTALDLVLVARRP